MIFTRIFINISIIFLLELKNEKTWKIKKIIKIFIRMYMQFYKNFSHLFQNFSKICVKFPQKFPKNNILNVIEKFSTEFS